MKCIKIITLFTIFLCYQVHHTFATHIKAGDISMQRVDTGDPASFTYDLIINLYRSTSGVNFQSGEVDFGDGTKKTLEESDYVLISTFSANTEHYQVKLRHVYTTAGTYEIGFLERNRNQAVCNMFASGQTPFYISSSVVVQADLGFNQAPVLLIPPIDQGTRGQRFVYNAGAVDYDGDSLSYELATPQQAKGVAVVNYKLPNDPAFSLQQEDGSTPPIFRIDEQTGSLLWDAPDNCECTRSEAGNEIGEYNIAFNVLEWRNGTVISKTNRDMQLTIYCQDNKRPQLIIPKDTCIVAGHPLVDTVFATDADQNTLELQAFLPTADMSFDLLTLQETAGKFSWQTTCEDVRKEPYTIYFKTNELNSDGSPALSDIQAWRVHVIAPAPVGLSTTANTETAIQLNWSAYECTTTDSMAVWRSLGSFELPDTCMPGLPSFTSYEKIGAVPIGTTSFLDNNLQRGATYCYRLVALAKDPIGNTIQSLASAEACQSLLVNAPDLTQVSISESDQINGAVQVTWTRPIAINEADFPKPWSYQVSRTENVTGNTNYTLLPTIFDEQDTSFTDSGLNTISNTYHYRVLFFSQGNLVDSSYAASTVKLTLIPHEGEIALTWEATVPWSNITSAYPYHYIYRKTASENSFTLIDSVHALSNGFHYVDNGTFNNQALDPAITYCYYVNTSGAYSSNPNISSPLVNSSQVGCSMVLLVGLEFDPIFDQVKLYPNPSKGTIRIDLGNLRGASLRVFSVEGKVISSTQKLMATQHQLEINGAAGIYLVELSINGLRRTFKIMKE